MNNRHIGIFALTLLPLLLTVPSAFADDDLSILDALDDLDNLETISDNNNFDIDFESVRSLYLAALEDPSLFAEAEAAHDDLYDQIYLKIEEQQDPRFDEYVESAKFSLTFLIENGPALGLTQPTILQLATTLEVLEEGTYDQIKAATGGNSQIGITLSVLPNLDEKLPRSFTTNSGAAEQLKAKLPPGIAKKYGYSTDNSLSTESSHGTDGTNSNPNDGDSILNFFEQLPGFGAASDDANPDAQGIGLGNIPWIFDFGFSPDDNANPPPFAEFGDADFEPGKYGKDISAEKIADAKLRADAGKAHKPADTGPPPEPPTPPCPPKKPGC